MAIKRNITDISALKRGANNVTAVYRGNILIWPTTPPTPSTYTINSWEHGPFGFGPVSPSTITINTWEHGPFGFNQKQFS